MSIFKNSIGILFFSTLVDRWRSEINSNYLFCTHAQMGKEIVHAYSRTN